MFSTSDRKQRYLPDWVILGDHSRAVFLGWILPETRLAAEEGHAIWIRYGGKLSIKQQEAHWLVETPALLPRTTLCFPPANGLDLDTSRRTKYAVLEEFPFRKQASMDLVREIETQGNEVLVVLMDLPRRQGSTDLIAPGEDLNLAAAAYRADGCDVSILQDAAHLRRMLHWHRPMYDAWVKKVQGHLADMSERIEGIPYDYPSLEEDWQDDGGPLQEQTMDRLFSYQTAKREKGKNLWDCYAAASRRALFPAFGQGPLAPVADLYKDCLDNPLVFWPVDADVKDFLDGLQDAFVKALETEEAKGRYRKKTPLPERLDEDSYFRLAARSSDGGTALNAVFSRRIKDYLCSDVKDALQRRLQQRYQQLEDMIP